MTAIKGTCQFTAVCYTLLLLSTIIMKIFSWLSCILVAVTAVNAKPQPTELHIETTYKPDVCTQQAKKGDVVSVHYVSRFREDPQIILILNRETLDRIPLYHWRKIRL